MGRFEPIRQLEKKYELPLEPGARVEPASVALDGTFTRTTHEIRETSEASVASPGRPTATVISRLETRKLLRFLQYVASMLLLGVMAFVTTPLWLHSVGDPGFGSLVAMIVLVFGSPLYVAVAFLVVLRFLLGQRQQRFVASSRIPR